MLRHIGTFNLILALIGIDRYKRLRFCERQITKDHGGYSKLIEDIGKRLNTKPDVSRFRAVCRSWRSSIPPVDLNLQIFSVKIWDHKYSYTIVHVYETAVYHHLVSLVINPDKVERDWLVKLYSPYQTFGVPREPQAREVMNFNTFEDSNWQNLMCLGECESSSRRRISDVMLIYGGWLYHGNLGRDKEGYVNVYRVDYEYSSYEEVIFYQGMFYAVNWYGRAVAVDSSLKLTRVVVLCTNYDFDKSPGVKSLVESSGDLLLVERIMRKCWCDGEPLTSDDKFKVYKLNAVEKRWVEMQASDLSDRILVVLGDDRCGFSFAAKDFLGCQGNCIYFCTKNSSQVRVFDLNSGTLSDLQSLPHSARIFLPRPTIGRIDHD